MCLCVFMHSCIVSVYNECEFVLALQSENGEGRKSSKTPGEPKVIYLRKDIMRRKVRTPDKSV